MAIREDALTRLTDGTVELPAYDPAKHDPQPRLGGWVASVAVILRPARPAPELLLIQRAEMESDPWSGHMAFPGGRREPEDPSLLDTAMRETLEETAVDLGDLGRPLGRLEVVRPVTRRLPPLAILPFVFAVPAGTFATIGSSEVAETHWVPLHHFEDPEHRVVHRLTLDDEAMAFPAYRHGERVIWGLTERILQDLLAHLS